MTRLSRPSDQPIARPGSPGAFITPTRSNIGEAIQGAGRQVQQGVGRFATSIARLEEVRTAVDKAAEEARAREAEKLQQAANSRALTSYGVRSRVAYAKAQEAADAVDPTQAAEVAVSSLEEFQNSYMENLSGVDEETRQRLMELAQADRELLAIETRRSAAIRLNNENAKLIDNYTAESIKQSTFIRTPQELEARIVAYEATIDSHIGTTLTEQEAVKVKREAVAGMRAAFAQTKLNDLATSAARSDIPLDDVEAMATELAGMIDQPADAVIQGVMAEAADAAATSGLLDRTNDILERVTLPPSEEAGLRERAINKNEGLTYEDLSKALDVGGAKVIPQVVKDAGLFALKNRGEDGWLSSGSYSRIMGQVERVQQEVFNLEQDAIIAEKLSAKQGRFLQSLVERGQVSKERINKVAMQQIDQIAQENPDTALDNTMEYSLANNVVVPEWGALFGRAAAATEEDITGIGTANTENDAAGIIPAYSMYVQLRDKDHALVAMHMDARTEQLFRNLDVAYTLSPVRGNFEASFRQAKRALENYGTVDKPTKDMVAAAVSDLMEGGWFASNATNELEMGAKMRGLAEYYSATMMGDNIDDIIAISLKQMQETHTKVRGRMVYTGTSTLTRAQQAGDLATYWDETVGAFLKANPDIGLTDDNLTVERHAGKWYLVDTATRSRIDNTRISDAMLMRVMEFRKEHADKDRLTQIVENLQREEALKRIWERGGAGRDNPEVMWSAFKRWTKRIVVGGSAIISDAWATHKAVHSINNIAGGANPAVLTTNREMGEFIEGAWSADPELVEKYSK